VSHAISIRDSIMSNILATLQGISVANGYLTTPKLISKDRIKLPNETPQDKFPCLYFIDTDEPKTDEGGQETQGNLQIVITGYTKQARGGVEGEVQEDMRKLLCDVERALTVDASRGNNAIWTRIDDVKTDKGWWHPFAVFDMIVTVVYSYTYGQPNI